MPHPFSGGWRRPSTRRMPRIVRDSGFRYFRPHVPGNWAVTVVNKSVLSSSVGNSIGSSPSSSATWMYDDMILFSSKRAVYFPQKQRSSETVFPIFLFFLFSSFSSQIREVQICSSYNTTNTHARTRNQSRNTAPLSLFSPPPLPVLPTGPPRNSTNVFHQYICSVNFRL